MVQAHDKKMAFSLLLANPIFSDTSLKTWSCSLKLEKVELDEKELTMTNDADVVKLFKIQLHLTLACLKLCHGL